MVKEFTDGKYTAYQERVKWRKDYAITIFRDGVFVTCEHLPKPLKRYEFKIFFKFVLPEYREETIKEIEELFKKILGGSDEHTD